MGDAAADADRVSAAFARLIEGLPRFPTGDSRARLRALTGPIASHLSGLDSIKVAGSNGKGSVVAMTAAILEAAGVRVAAFVSPHVRRPAERVMVEGQPLDADRFEASATWARARVDDHIKSTGATPGIFEAILALSLYAAANLEVDALVVEAGIGGRLDPTGILSGSLTGLVSVDLEHTELLGDTLEAIALDKADLADDDSTLVVGNLGGTLIDDVRTHVAPRGVRVAEAVDDSIVADATITLVGDHQVENARLATHLARSWLGLNRLTQHRSGRSVSDIDTAIRQGLSAATLPGRLQCVARDPDIWVDVAHTPKAVAAVAEAMLQRLDGRPLVLVVGVSEGRDPEALLAPLVDLDPVAVIVTRASARGTDPMPIGKVFATRGGPVIVVAPDVAAAIDHARIAARSRGASVLATGSFFLAAEALSTLGGAA